MTKTKLPRWTPDRIKRVRGDRTQAEAAALVGVSQELWSCWERGTRAASTAHQILLALFESGKLKK